MKQNKKERFHIEEIKAHPFFSGIDFGGLFNSQVPIITSTITEQNNDINYVTMGNLNVIPDYFGAWPEVVEPLPHIIKEGIILLGNKKFRKSVEEMWFVILS